MFENIPDICALEQKSQLTCPHNQVFFTASAVWGLIGPSRQFGKGTIYNPQLYALVIGAVIPFPFWIYQKYYPKSWVQYVSTPIILTGVGYMPPATGINYSSWFAVGFVFQYYIRRRNFLWWSKFNYVTSAALDTGTFSYLSFEVYANHVLPLSRRHLINHVHILHTTAAERRLDKCELVGEHRLAEQYVSVSTNFECPAL